MFGHAGRLEFLRGLVLDALQNFYFRAHRDELWPAGLYFQQASDWYPSRTMTDLQETVDLFIGSQLTN